MKKTKLERAKSMTLDKWCCILFMILAGIDVNAVWKLSGDRLRCGFCVEYRWCWNCPLPKTSVCDGSIGNLYSESLQNYDVGNKTKAIKLVEKLINIVENLQGE